MNGLNDDELDDEDRAILAEISKKGYYHGRPKSEACAPPAKIEAPQPILLPNNGRTPDEIRESRLAYDAFQKKWDAFGREDYIEELEEQLVFGDGEAEYEAESDEQSDELEFNVLLVGDKGVGKTALLLRHLTGAFTRDGGPLDAEAQTLRFETNCGELALQVRDLSSAPKRAGSRRARDNRLQCCHAAIVMFDLTSKETYASLPYWCGEVKRVCGSVPTVLVGNKADLPGREMSAAVAAATYGKRGMQYFEASAKSNFQLERPFLWLARRLLGQPRLRFVKPFAMAPSAQVDAALAALHARQLAEAQRRPVEDDAAEL